MPSTRSTDPPSNPGPKRRGIGVGNGIGVGRGPGLHTPPLPSAASFEGYAASASTAGAGDFDAGGAGEGLLGPLDPEILAIAQAVAQAEAAAGTSTPTDRNTNGGVADGPESLGELPAGSGQGEGEGGPEDQAEDQAEGEEGQMDVGDDDIHPALREIVKSLTNAQQQNGDATQGGPMIDPALEGTEDAELHATLANLGSHHFSTLFPSSFSHTEDSNFLLPEPVASSSTPVPHPNDILSDLPHGDDPSSSTAGLSPPPTDDGAPRKRGRPKGSKNKIQREPRPRPVPPPKPPRIPKEPKRPRVTGGKVGRPRKVRTEEEEAKFERRVAERKAGVRRPRGRPRMFPGHLVRELRLRENRAEFGRLKREAWEAGERAAEDDEGGDMDVSVEHVEGELDYPAEGSGGGHAMEVENGYYSTNGHADGVGRVERDGQMENYDWSNDPQNLLQGLAQAGEIQAHEGDQPDRQHALGLPGEGTERDLTEVLGLRGGGEHVEMAE